MFSADKSGRTSVRLRVICWKSAYFTFSVTVRPRISAPSQVRQTFSMIGWNTSHAASNVKISAEKVFSAPRDLRIRSAWTGRSSTPRALKLETRPGLHEVRLNKGMRQLSEFDLCFDPEPIHLRCRRRPNAVELLDRQFSDEGRPHLRCNDEEAIGLKMIRGEL